MSENRETGKDGLSARIARELLGSPTFKAALNLMLSEIDPASAPGLARTLIRRDPEVFMALASAAPALVNLWLGMLKEIVAQLGSFPPALLRGFAAQVLAEVDAEMLGEVLGGLVTVLGSLEGREGEEGMLAGAAGSVGSGYRAARGAEGGAAPPAAERIGRALRDNPAFVDRVLRPIAAGLRDACPDIFGPAALEQGGAP